ncbi:MAG TPA: SDR family oxidoreductase [Candidatus Dormibacteraeota bacterium]|nr:SDR family oxidoreductase [Candidatus Dormibacteraeota bacterium]
MTRLAGTRLAGKVALVTGGGSGIGKAVALAFAAEGAKVAVMGRRLEKVQEVAAEVKKRGGDAVAIAGDVAKAADAERAVRETVEKLGGLNVLVNNAGMLSVATVETVPEEEWDRVMTVNVKGPFLMSRAALPALRKAGGGAIVNIGSIVGLIAIKNRAAYSTSKGAVTMLTKAMALDHAHENIRVNCICPALVETELVQRLFASADGEAVKRERIAGFPVGRMGQPQDVAGMAVFLASEESSWVTGTAIPLDGGLSAY